MIVVTYCCSSCIVTKKKEYATEEEILAEKDKIACPTCNKTGMRIASLLLKN